MIDVVTRSGTNDLHGDALSFGRRDALGARDYFNHQINGVWRTTEVSTICLAAGVPMRLRATYQLGLLS